MNPVLQQGQTRTCWVVCEERGDGLWFQRGFPQETQAQGYKKLHWLRRWHPNAFLSTIVLTQCDDNHEPSVPAPPSNQCPTGKPQLRLV